MLPRMYLGQITTLAISVAVVFIAGAVASRFYSNRRAIHLLRNLIVAILIGGFAASMVYTLEVNQIPQARIDRGGADQDQKSFEQRHTPAR